MLTCCDVYGNDGGDWVGWLAWQAGIEGNFAEDPLFCELVSSKLGSPLRLHEDSPCLPGNHPDGWDCGLIGAEESV